MVSKHGAYHLNVQTLVKRRGWPILGQRSPDHDGCSTRSVEDSRPLTFCVVKELLSLQQDNLLSPVLQLKRGLKRSTTTEICLIRVRQSNDENECVCATGGRL